MLMVESSAGLERMMNALCALHGYSTDQQLAEAITDHGYQVSQQSVSNYRHGRNPPLGYVVGYIKALELEGEQRRELLRAYMDRNPEYEDFLRLWASI